MVYAVKDMADFKSQLESAGDQLVVVDFFATWCSPCKTIGPHFEEMSKDTSVVFLKVDIDNCDDIAAEYKITRTPTFIFIKNKQKVGDVTGADIKKLKEMVAANK